MPWSKVTVSRALANLNTLDRTKLIMLTKMMSDEIVDNLELIEEFTKAYSILRDVIGDNDNYKSITDLFGKAAHLAQDYPDSGWLLSKLAIGKVAPRHRWTPKEVKKLSEELAEFLNKDDQRG